MSTRGEIVSICVRLAAAAALSWMTVRYMVKYLDPNYSVKEEAKRKVLVDFFFYVVLNFIGCGETYYNNFASA